MGCYINPENESKEAFLKRHGRSVTWPLKITDTHVPVCLVDNGLFTAAAVAWCESELQAFQRPGDNRPKQWYIVPRDEVRKVSDLAHYER